MRALLILAVATMGLAACDPRYSPDRKLPYRATLKDNAGALSVSVKTDGGISLDRLRESVRFPVTQHCLTRNGNTDADWVLDPRTGDWAYATDGQGTLTFQARCRA